MIPDEQKINSSSSNTDFAPDWRQEFRRTITRPDKNYKDSFVSSEVLYEWEFADDTSLNPLTKSAWHFLQILFPFQNEKELNLGEMVKELLRNDSPVYCEYLTSWFDIGTHADLKKADKYYSNHR